jgi:DNA-directed RNA polymerase sigma subunit (sigma70/sigma32)
MEQIDNLSEERWRRANIPTRIKIICVGDELVVEDALGNRWNPIVANQQLTEAFADLASRDRDILRLRLGLDDGRLRSVEEIGWLFGITGTRVQTRQDRAIRRVNSRQERR